MWGKRILIWINGFSCNSTYMVNLFTSLPKNILKNICIFICGASLYLTYYLTPSVPYLFRPFLNLRNSLHLQGLLNFFLVFKFLVLFVKYWQKSSCLLVRKIPPKCWDSIIGCYWFSESMNCHFELSNIRDIVCCCQD